MDKGKLINHWGAFILPMSIAIVGVLFLFGDNVAAISEMTNTHLEKQKHLNL